MYYNSVIKCQESFNNYSWHFFIKQLFMVLSGFYPGAAEAEWPWNIMQLLFRFI